MSDEDDIVGGASIAEMVDDANVDSGAEEQVPPVEGREQQLSLFAGGEEPTGSSMSLRGGKIPVEGEFEKGDTLTLTIQARVSEIHFVDKIDDDGYVVSSERKHVARITSVRRATV